MTKRKVVLWLLLLLIINISNAEVFYNILKQDLCTNICEEIDSDFKYLTNSCRRGCRFFNLVELTRQLEPNNINSTLDACYASCTEAYAVSQVKSSCKIGCIFMANRQVKDLTSLVENGIRANILLTYPDNPESDVLSDPGFEKEFLRKWWDTNDFKLSETFFKTVPIDSETVDYSISSEYVGEYEKSTSTPGSDWLQCASRHTGIPRWLIVLAIATAVLSTIWLCLSPEKPNESVDKITVVKPNYPNRVRIILPDEAPLLKKPPPKYSEVDVNDLNLSV